MYYRRYPADRITLKLTVSSSISLSRMQPQLIHLLKVLVVLYAFFLNRAYYPSTDAFV
jgi:hypothetical protein